VCSTGGLLMAALFHTMNQHVFIFSFLMPADERGSITPWGKHAKHQRSHSSYSSYIQTDIGRANLKKSYSGSSRCLSKVLIHKRNEHYTVCRLVMDNSRLLGCPPSLRVALSLQRHRHRHYHRPPPSYWRREWGRYILF
jgi:hypothetical protein